jgi:hypothetical protein
MRRQKMAEAQTRILQLLDSNAQFEPSELIAQLESDFDAVTIREAILDLLERAGIEWTPKRYLTKPHLAPAHI